jgi:hypothetical protein
MSIAEMALFNDLADRTVRSFDRAGVESLDVREVPAAVPEVF